MSTVSGDSIPNADYGVPIPEHVPIIQADPALGDFNDERDGDNWSSRMSFNRVKHGLGLLPRAQSATSGCNERMNSIK